MFFPGEERLEANVLAMRIQPDEGISLRFGAKVPGPTMQLQEVDMNFLYGSSFGPTRSSGDAYERLLLDAMLGDRTLFTRADEVEQAWKWAEDIQEGWSPTTQQRALLSSRDLGPGLGRRIHRARWPPVAAPVPGTAPGPAGPRY